MSASPEGIGPVWQLTAVDTATRYAIGELVAGDKSARDTAAFVDHVTERLAGIGVELTGVLTDNGPEFTGHGFTSRLEERGVRHHRIPPRSPNHNAVCERFQGTALQEFYRPAFHRQHFARLADLGAQFQGWLQHYNPGVATTATSCAAARPLRSWRPTYHDHAKGPPVTSTRTQEALAPRRGRYRAGITRAQLADSARHASTSVIAWAVLWNRTASIPACLAATTLASKSSRNTTSPGWTPSSWQVIS
jgi:Integrase core domain